MKKVTPTEITYVHMLSETGNVVKVIEGCVLTRAEDEELRK